MNWAEVLPTLQRFYRGGDPVGWLRVPLNILNAFLAYIPVLEARESLRRVQEYQVGTGSIKRRAAERIIRGWERLARVEEPAADAPKITKGEYIARMRQLGIKVNIQ